MKTKIHATRVGPLAANRRPPARWKSPYGDGAVPIGASTHAFLPGGLHPGGTKPPGASRSPAILFASNPPVKSRKWPGDRAPLAGQDPQQGGQGPARSWKRPPWAFPWRPGREDKEDWPAIMAAPGSPWGRMGSGKPTGSRRGTFGVENNFHSPHQTWRKGRPARHFVPRISGPLWHERAAPGPLPLKSRVTYAWPAPGRYRRGPYARAWRAQGFKAPGAGILVACMVCLGNGYGVESALARKILRP